MLQTGRQVVCKLLSVSYIYHNVTLLGTDNNSLTCMNPLACYTLMSVQMDDPDASLCTSSQISPRQQEPEHTSFPITSVSHSTPAWPWSCQIISPDLHPSPSWIHWQIFTQELKYLKNSFHADTWTSVWRQHLGKSNISACSFNGWPKTHYFLKIKTILW